MHFLLGLGFYFGVVSLSGFLRNQDSTLHSWFHCCDECQLRFLSHAGGDGRSRPHLPFPLLCRRAGGHCCSSCFFWVFGLKLLPGVGIDCCVCGLQTFLIMQPYLQKYFEHTPLMYVYIVIYKLHAHATEILIFLPATQWIFLSIPLWSSLLWAVKTQGEPGGWWHKLGQISCLPRHSKVFLLFPVFFRSLAPVTPKHRLGIFPFCWIFRDLTHYLAGLALVLLLRWAEVCCCSWKNGCSMQHASS